ncbi:MAG: alpha/beta hydrolase [Cyanobacteriota bacterium ELA615]|jgi:pimeloyl-ACP methyl ester carboxylesterase
MSENLTIAGVKYYYQWVKKDSNQAKPVMVFVHGWAGSAKYWYSTAEILSDQFDCLLYDLRGFGRTGTSPNADYELETYAQELYLLLNELGISQVYLHGHSMGASIAALFLADYPEKVTKAILTCNGIFEYNKAAFSAFYFFGKYVVKLRYKWFLQIPLADRLFMARFLARPIPTGEYRAFLEDFLAADGDAALGTIYTCVSKKAVEIMPDKFAAISVPTLLIAGEKDQIIPPKLGRAAAALNQKIKYIEMKQTGHFPMLEDPQEYIKQVKDFL